MSSCGRWLEDDKVKVHLLCMKQAKNYCRFNILWWLEELLMNVLRALVLFALESSTPKASHALTHFMWLRTLTSPR